MSTDQTKEFLESLPELEKGKTFCFKCYPGISCFNECCGDLQLVLTPYDVLRLCRELDMPSRDFVHSHCEVEVMPDTRFPMLRLRMTDNARRSCPFVREAGCSVYENRPGACRTYPLGRATRPNGEGGVQEQFFVVQEPHCRGFEESTEWTTDTWLKDQGFEIYVKYNDKYMNLLARWKETGKSLPDQVVHMAMLALYQLDDFRRMIDEMKMFERVDVPEERQAAIMESDEAALDFGLDWLELMLFRTSETLRPRA
ncbi:YkgJ family cysteine cluster protein [Pseudodesulfovibrio senegalensis]|uniref:YkgJ family cysteine cluster protein n=1 Tax=Pseudodesulfovibrio senegalensis TaxID=1721087 RepID=A0A6N6N0Q5_9BACT|nr:YkgJ family cysteine cluster protein [Pseudodesulfovibrio senegalensis]KAB1439030.1 YkgJ family cysteine cluster protein [Pseudodesulfovibrio senegalensis]